MSNPANLEFDLSTRMQLLQRLRRGPATVAELATAVGLTGNGVRVGLAVLERDGLVRRIGVRHGEGAGKPPLLYAATPKADQELSRAYIPALSALTAVLSRHIPPDQLKEVFAATGAELARDLTSPTGSDPAVAAQALLQALGASVDIERGGETVVVAGTACPLTAVVRHCAEACEIVRVLLAESTGADVTTECIHGDAPRCRFAVR